MIVLRGPHVGPGYTDPRRNAGMLAADGTLISGDLGHVDAGGRVFVTGRTKDVIVRGAHDIDPTMIEEAFAAHPDEHTCAAVGEPDTYAGELPVVFLSLHPCATASAAEILAQVSARIVGPAAVPKRLTVLDTLPTTAIGKIYKPALRLRAVEQAYGDALAEIAGRIGPVRVAGIERPGGLAAEISLPATADREPVEQEIAAALARYAIPYELRWQ